MQLTGAEISAQCLSSLNYQFTARLWSFGQAAGTDSVLFDFGDGIQTWVPVSSASSTSQIGNGPYFYTVLQNQHAYSVSSPPGGYEITVVTGNRIAGIGNIANSANTVMRLKMNLVVDPLIGCNSLPVSVNLSLKDTVYISQNNQFNIAVADNDGDSLDFSFLPCDDAVSSINYTFPSGLVIDPVTGNYSWNSASQPGLYNILIKTENWFRFPNGNYISAGYSVREIQIYVTPLLGIHDDPENFISFFPNPAQPGMPVNLSIPMSGNASVRLLSVNGQCIWQENRYYANTDRLIIPDLPDALYFLEFRSESGQTITSKVLIRNE